MTFVLTFVIVRVMTTFVMINDILEIPSKLSNFNLNLEQTVYFDKNKRIMML